MADGSVALTPEIKAAFDAYQRTVEGFKSSNDERLNGIEKKFDDVVKREETDRINTALTELKQNISDQIAELKRGANGGDDDEAAFDAKANEIYALEVKAMDAYIRQGVDEGKVAFAAAKAKAAEYELKDLSTVIAEDGGFLVRPEHEADMIEIVEEISDLRPILGQMESGTREKIVNVDQGGFLAAWITELTERVKTATGTLSQRRFTAEELYAFHFITETMKEDAEFDVMAWLMKKATQAIARAEGAAFISGDGIKKPKGILSQTIVANASWAWGKLGYIATGHATSFAPSVPGSQLGPTASTNGADCLFDLTHSLPKRYRSNCDWVMNRLTLAATRKLKDADGNYLFKDALTGSGFLSTLLGFPITEAEDMPDIGAGEYPIAFGDFEEGYLVIDRTGISIKRDDITEPQFDKVYIRRRVGGDVADYQAIKLLKVAAS